MGGSGEGRNAVHAGDTAAEVTDAWEHFTLYTQCRHFHPPPPPPDQLTCTYTDTGPGPYGAFTWTNPFIYTHLSVRAMHVAMSVIVPSLRLELIKSYSPEPDVTEAHCYVETTDK